MNQKISTSFAIAVIVIIAGFLTGVFWFWGNKKVEAPTEIKIETVPQKQGIANPASTFCVQNGGKNEIRTNPDGSQSGYCVFENNKECEEWAFKQGACSKFSGKTSLFDQSFRNEKFGYEISYSKDYSIFEDANQEKETTIPANSNSQKIFITDKPELFFGSEPAYLSVEVLGEYVDDFEKWVNDKFINTENSYRIIEKGEVTFEGVRAYQVKSECGIDSPKNVIIVNHRDKTYLVRYDNEECFPQSEKILSTFKFTK